MDKDRTVPAKEGTYRVDLAALPQSKFYKFVLETPNTTLNRWYPVTREKYTTYKFPVEYSN